MIRLRPAKHYLEVMNSTGPLLFGIVLIVVIGVCEQYETFAFGQKEESVPESMRRLSADIIAAYEKRDVAALESFYAKQPDALFFWERKMSYSWSEIDSTIDALVSAVTQLKYNYRVAVRRFWQQWLVRRHISRRESNARRETILFRWALDCGCRKGEWTMANRS